MKKIRSMSQIELAAYIQDLLEQGGNQAGAFRWKCSFFL